MQSQQPALPFRDDNILGICQAVGDDFGFNPLWLRIAFAALLIWQPAMVVGAYLALGLVVAFSRLLVPNRRPAAETVAALAQTADNEDSEKLAIAA
jgi:phage shock protein PspC (stress-responsive transcriptional regulator)